VCVCVCVLLHQNRGPPRQRHTCTLQIERDNEAAAEGKEEVLAHLDITFGLNPKSYPLIPKP
jgi:hypothetical protein